MSSIVRHAASLTYLDELCVSTLACQMQRRLSRGIRPVYELGDYRARGAGGRKSALAAMRNCPIHSQASQYMMDILTAAFCRSLGFLLVVGVSGEGNVANRCRIVLFS